MLLTLVAVAVKVAESAPAGTRTDVGTVRAVLLSDSVTVNPPDGAAWVSVTVQVLVLPEVTLFGVHTSEDRSTGATTVTAADWEAPPSEAVMVAF